MPSSTTPSVDIALAWARSGSGRTAILRRESEDESWDEVARVEGTAYTVSGVTRNRAHYFAAAAVAEDGSLDPEEEWETVRIAPVADASRPERPETPAGFAAAQDGPNLNLRWDAATDDVTRSYEIRVGSSWEDAMLVADGVTGTSYQWPWWSSGTVVLHLAAVGPDGRVSLEKATAGVTIEALDTHVTDDEVDEAAGPWTGTRTNMDEDSGDLRLASFGGPFGAYGAIPFGSLDGIPWGAMYHPSGTYQTPEVNVGAKERHRVEVEIGHEQPIMPSIPFARLKWPAITRRTRRDGTPFPLGTIGSASRNSFRMTPLPPVDLTVDIDTSLSGGGAWEGWRRYVPGTYTFWRMRLRVTVRGDGLRYVSLPSLRHRRRLFNRKAEGVVATVLTGPLEVLFADVGATFQRAPVVTATLQQATGDLGVKIEVTSVTATGFYVEAFDGAGNAVALDVGWHAMGP